MTMSKAGFFVDNSALPVVPSAIIACIHAQTGMLNAHMGVCQVCCTQHFFWHPRGWIKNTFYTNHQPPRCLWNPVNSLTGHISSTFILQRQTWELENQDIRRNEFLVTRTKPTYDGFRTRASKRTFSANANHSAARAALSS